jgi:hypothetical protein
VGLDDALRGGELKVGALRDRYGDRPLHLIAVVISFGIAGYAFLQIAGNPGPVSFAVFFVGAILAHDLIAFPIYSSLNAVAGRAARTVALGPATINYLRVPGLLSGFALIAWFPLILALDSGNYESSTGTSPPDYLGRWLALTALLYAASGIVYALRSRRPGRAPGRATDPRRPRSRR